MCLVVYEMFCHLDFEKSIIAIGTMDLFLFLLHQQTIFFYIFNLSYGFHGISSNTRKLIN